MPADRPIIIGTRGSSLSLAQTALVAEALKQMHPELAIETRVITTKGDTDQSPIPLDTIGKAWFTGEIEQALMEGAIDLAVHSLKDMEQGSMPELLTVTVLHRADPRDVLISKLGASLKDLPQGAVVGTDSIRRKVLLLERRPDLVIKSIRGNVDTRIKKLQAENYDAIVLAAAGLERLGMLDLATELFDPAVFSVAPGQGVLAAEARSDRPELLLLLRSIEDETTKIQAQAELAFSRAVGGGCKLPIGCFAEVHGDIVSIHGMVGNPDDNKVRRFSAEGRASEAPHVAEDLAKKFL